jgi:hypothetical protein
LPSLAQKRFSLSNPAITPARNSHLANYDTDSC